MKTLTKTFAIAVLVCAAIAVHPSSALGWSHNEHLINNTGATAYDVVKILAGDYTITEMADWDFADTEFYHRSVDGEIQTVLRWSNGTVPDGDRGDVCFTAVPLGGAPRAEIIGAWWTDQQGNPFGNYNPAITMQVDFADLNNPVLEVGNLQAAEINVNAGNPNRWEDGDFTLTGIPAPLTNVAIQAAVVDGALGMEDLVVENTIFHEDPVVRDSYVDVFTELTIGGGDTVSADLGPFLGPVRYGQSVVLVVDHGGGNYDLVNFDVPEPCSLLLLGLGSLGVLRHRRQR